jgi:hypothetical protein
MEKQIHSQFKVFVTSPDSNGNIPPDLQLTINGFIALNKVAVKSVGVENYQGKIVISLGYVTDQESYPVAIECVNMGLIAGKEGQDLSTELENALTKAAEGLQGAVICHEFYVDHKNEFVALFLKAVK